MSRLELLWPCHFKTDPTETVAFCFGYPKIPSSRAFRTRPFRRTRTRTQTEVRNSDSDSDSDSGSDLRNRDFPTP
jgi:hypothetical protein